MAEQFQQMYSVNSLYVTVSPRYSEPNKSRPLSLPNFVKLHYILAINSSSYDLRVHTAVQRWQHMALFWCKSGLQMFQINMDLGRCYDDSSQNVSKYEIENTNRANYYHTSTTPAPLYEVTESAMGWVSQISVLLNLCQCLSPVPYKGY